MPIRGVFGQEFSVTASSTDYISETSVEDIMTPQPGSDQGQPPTVDQIQPVSEQLQNPISLALGHSSLSTSLEVVPMTRQERDSEDASVITRRSVHANSLTSTSHITDSTTNESQSGLRPGSVLSKDTEIETKRQQSTVFVNINEDHGEQLQVQTLPNTLPRKHWGKRLGVLGLFKNLTLIIVFSIGILFLFYYFWFVRV